MECRSALGQGPLEDRTRALSVDAKFEERSLVPLTVLGVAMHRRERPRGALGIQVRRHAMAHEFHEPRALFRPSEEITEDGFVVSLRGLPDGPRDLPFVDSDGG